MLIVKPSASFNITIDGMTCTACALRVEKALRKLAEVAAVEVNLANNKASIYGTEQLNNPSMMKITIDEAIKAVLQSGYYVRTQTIRLKIVEMTCASCVGRVEKTLLKVPGVVSAQVNLASGIALVDVLIEVPLNILIHAVQDAGYQASIQDEVMYQSLQAHSSMMSAEKHDQDLSNKSALLQKKISDFSDIVKQKKSLFGLIFLIACTLPLVLPMMLMPLGIHWMLPLVWQWILASVVQFVFGASFYRAAFYALRAKAANMDVLVVLGTSAAYGLSVYLVLKYLLMANYSTMPDLYFEASSVIICLVRVGKWLEARAKQQTLSALSALQALQPEMARVRQPDGSDVDLAIHQVQLNDVVVVRPGERVAVDGLIIEGESELDEALITGESLPVHKQSGDSVKAGVVNHSGVLLVRTLAIGAESSLARIIRLIEHAQASKAPIQKMVDRVSQIFVPIVVLCALLTLCVWLWMGVDSSVAIIHAVSVLVIACPCALGLATPAAIITGTGAAARQGILIKDAQTLEMAHRVKIVVFDKTGTLTVGKPTVVAIETLQDVSLDPALPMMDEVYMVQLAASIQAQSTHPLALAILERHQSYHQAHHQANNAQDLTLFPAREIKALPGRGVSAVLELPEGEQIFYLGNTRLMTELGVDLQLLKTRADELQAQGHSISWLAHASTGAARDYADVQAQQLPLMLLGLFAFGDDIKPNAILQIEQLKKMGVRTVLLTGDHLASAQRVANALQMDEFFAERLPEDKASIIQQLKQPYLATNKRIVAMVGDGINDAPALAAADVSLAMATGTDIAMNTAGITLMRGDLTLVAGALDISRKTYQKMRQNLFWALVYNVLGIPLAALGWLNPMLAGSAMAFSSICVIGNALLLRRWKLKRV